MNETGLLLKAYYEALYELLEAKKAILSARIRKLLRKEITPFGVERFKNEKYTAYRDACLAFLDERLETYNPIGIQYTFDRIRAHEAIQLELQLDWYDSTVEFEVLMELIRGKVAGGITEEEMWQLAGELIREVGAFPDKSIISAYEAEPALSKLPDYVVARAIEGSLDK
ncbi:unnamed protein product [marine sediment metagenome]|uniref:Uncharacterized protein n=1 Tax=marine sediment metagenome TaxID=412755 RepID=X1MN33_9ZZZZ